MAQKPDGKPARTERVAFTRPAAERIAKAVRTVEAGNRDCGPLTFGARLDTVAPKAFRICTFTGAWAIDSEKQVTFRNQTTTPNTVSAMNLFLPLSDDGTATRNCAIAKDGTAWYLLQVKYEAISVFTAASLTTSGIEFLTAPALAISTGSTNKVTLSAVAEDVIVGASLGSSLEFTRKSVGVLFANTASTVSISITTCATATGS